MIWIPPLTFSELLGYTSITCWLFAQFPQVLENWRRQSCEGLALPFLANWFLGDLSNLIGCILTHQLPFQKWLAVYFVFVDLTLVVQYFYYSGLSKSYPRPIPSVSRTRRLSTEREVARYRTLSAVAANVAATAALAAQHDENEHRHRRPRPSVDRAYDNVRERRFQEPDDEDVDENVLTALADSFHSEREQETRRQRFSWSIEPHRARSGSVGQIPRVVPPTTSQQISSTESLLDLAGRGRPLEREFSESYEPEATSPNRRSSRASRRGGIMVFLSMSALFGIGSTVTSQYSIPSHSTPSIGKVLAVRSYELPDPALNYNSPVPMENLEAAHYFSSGNGRLSFENLLPAEPFSERVVGRIFAWLCTILYLTSRLPQIWKNFVRKSVQGLSMYLFVFAFLGNTFYVWSILSNPNMHLPREESIAFLKESLPYLLGSGGTLMFDVTIVTQSFIYRPRRRRTSIHNRLEETDILTGDPLIRPIESTAQHRGRTSLIRSSV